MKKTNEATPIPVEPVIPPEMERPRLIEDQIVSYLFGRSLKEPMYRVETIRSAPTIHVCRVQKICMYGPKIGKFVIFDSLQMENLKEPMVYHKSIVTEVEQGRLR